MELGTPTLTNNLLPSTPTQSPISPVGGGGGNFLTDIGNTLTKNTQGFSLQSAGNFANYTPQTPMLPGLGGGAFNISVPKVIPSNVLSTPTTTAKVTQARNLYQQALSSNQSASNTPPNTINGPISNATPQYGTGAPQSFTTPSGANVDASGNLISAPPTSTSANPYAEYARQLATADSYSPEYLAALQKVNELNAQEAQLRGNLATGNVPGDTQGFAEGFTDRALMGAGAQEAFANIGLQTQELMRQGNIAGAKALLDAYAPQSVSPGSSLVSPATGQTVYGGAGAYSDYQAQQTYFNLAQNFPDANIPAYNPQLSAQQNLQIAQQAAQQSPSFQSRSTIPVTLPGGGYALVNKNQVAGYRPDGTAIIVSPADAAQAQAYQKQLSDNQTQLSQVQGAVQTADLNFPILLQAAKAAGVNNSNPLINQLQQKLGQNFSTSPAFAALQTMIPSLQTEYARIINRGGSGGSTVDERKTSQALINGTYSLGQLQAVYDTVKRESANVIAGFQTQIDSAKNGLNQLYNTSSATTQPQSGTVNAPMQPAGTNPFSPENFFGQ